MQHNSAPSGVCQVGPVTFTWLASAIAALLESVGFHSELRGICQLVSNDCLTIVPSLQAPAMTTGPRDLEQPRMPHLDLEIRG